MASLNIAPGNPIVGSGGALPFSAFYDDGNGTVTDVTSSVTWGNDTTANLTYSWSRNSLTVQWTNAPAGTVLLTGGITASYDPGSGSITGRSSVYVLAQGTSTNNVLLIYVLGVTYAVNTATNPWTIAPLGSSGSGPRPTDTDVFITNATPATQIVPPPALGGTSYITCFLVNLTSLANS